MKVISPEDLKLAFKQREAEVKDEISEDFNKAIRKRIRDLSPYLAMTFKWPHSQYVPPFAKGLEELGFRVKVTEAGTDAHLEVRW